MGSIFSYALASSLILCLGYLSYKWILAGERQHAYNRGVLYAIYASALLLPFLAENRGTLPHLSSGIDSGIEIGEISGGIILPANQAADSSEDLTPRILTYIYLAGAAATLVYSIGGAWQLIRIIRNGEKITKGKYTLVISDRNDIAPFSWMRFYVMSRRDFETAGELISIHERRHLQLHHWIDLLFSQIICIFQWFNPAAWLMSSEFKTVHEYQADDAVLSAGADIRQYQTLLIKKAVGMRFQVLANSLNHSKLKKRVTMMYKSNSSKSRRMGALFIVPAMAIGCAVIEIPAVASVLDSTAEVSLLTKTQDNGKVNDFPVNSEDIPAEKMVFQEKTEADRISETPASADVATEKDSTPISSWASENAMNSSREIIPAQPDTPATDEKKEIYVAVEQPAEFPGGMAELMKYLSNNVRYPEDAHKNGIQGRVIVKFVVEKDGSIGDVTVLRGVDPSIDQEAIRIIKGMPKWQPGKNAGEPVASFFNLPVTFKLTDDGNSNESKTGETDKSKQE